MLRLIDSSLNRVCEGFRVVEDILRFKYNSEELSKKLKELRHRVRSDCYNYDNDLLNSRDVISDVGLEVTKDLNLNRPKTLISLICGNFKRIQEGLRCLEEITKTQCEHIDHTKYEEIRYDSYNLEKEIIGLISRKSFTLPPLYGLTYLEQSNGRTNIQTVEEMIKSGIKIIQYREKNLSFKDKYLECIKIRELTRSAGVIFIVNDHIDIAILVDADGVHIGQNDIPIKDVRRILGFNKIIGLSTHSQSQAKQAVIDGADYIGVGPIYSTKTKKNVCDPVGLEYLTWCKKNINIPFVSIGGIKENNIHEVLDCGALSVAIVSDITAETDIQSKIIRINKIIKEYLNDI